MIDLAKLRPLVEMMAAERTKDRPSDFEECVQEGLIAAWTASEAYPDKEPAYYHAAARNGVLNVLRGRSPFGAPSHRGRQQIEATVPLSFELDGETVDIEQEDPAAAHAFEAVDLVDAVRDAVAELPREDALLVHGRYWEDRGFRDLSVVLGRPEGTLSRRWTQVIRPQLAAQLEELVAS